ncbi:MAG: type II toxin-antitoxin system RelE/ParE family toxin [Clostridia bacterium]|nr:type II toxin-antitoxin system RelE/ParE family toxin [Clostridia bacterium]
MENRQYEVRVLPLFITELQDILDYISLKLHNPQAADQLERAVYDAIVERSSCAEAFEPIVSRFRRRYVFYRIYVRNYTIFYSVMGNVMEVQSIMYNRRDTREYLK